MRKIIFNEGAPWVCPDCGAHLDYKREPHDCVPPEKTKVEKKPEPKVEENKAKPEEEPKTKVDEKTGQLYFDFGTSALKEALLSAGQSRKK